MQKNCNNLQRSFQPEIKDEKFSFFLHTSRHSYESVKPFHATEVQKKLSS